LTTPFARQKREAAEVLWRDAVAAVSADADTGKLDGFVGERAYSTPAAKMNGESLSIAPPV
jgi:hypothetical protein